MIIPKFIYEEIVRVKENKAYKNGVQNAIEHIEFIWAIRYGSAYNKGKAIAVEEVEMFLKEMRECLLQWNNE